MSQNTPPLEANLIFYINEAGFEVVLPRFPELKKTSLLSNICLQGKKKNKNKRMRLWFTKNALFFFPKIQTLSC